jgi:hypothetical protein
LIEWFEAERVIEIFILDCFAQLRQCQSLPFPEFTTKPVPPFVYLYASLGALGYIFTKIMMASEGLTGPGATGELVSMGMRIPAAWVLGAGFYLLLAQSGADPVSDAHLFATVAFLVGLYVNVAIKSLGALADRMLGRGSRP